MNQRPAHKRGLSYKYLVISTCYAYVGSFAGCATATPKRRWTEHVQEVNDTARWAGAAVSGTVHPSYREKFAERRRQWGKDVRIGNTEVSALNPDAGESEAVSVIALEWYDERTMRLHTTSVRQTWRKSGTEYRLADECVLEGSTGMFWVPANADLSTASDDLDHLKCAAGQAVPAGEAAPPGY